MSRRLRCPVDQLGFLCMQEEQGHCIIFLIAGCGKSAFGGESESGCGDAPERRAASGYRGPAETYLGKGYDTIRHQTVEVYAIDAREAYNASHAGSTGPIAPAQSKSDEDWDGIQNDSDACPKVPGDASPIPAWNGCPLSDAQKAIRDSDRDEIPDPWDACPNEPGVYRENDPRSGCPESEPPSASGTPLPRTLASIQGEWTTHFTPWQENRIVISGSRADWTHRSPYGKTEETGTVQMGPGASFGCELHLSNLVADILEVTTTSLKLGMALDDGKRIVQVWTRAAGEPEAQITASLATLAGTWLNEDERVEIRADGTFTRGSASGTHVRASGQVTAEDNSLAFANQGGKAGGRDASATSIILRLTQTSMRVASEGHVEEWRRVDASGRTDLDGDGVTDDVDGCPSVAGEPSKDPARNGCPKTLPLELATIAGDWAPLRVTHLSSEDGVMTETSLKIGTEGRFEQTNQGQVMEFLDGRASIEGDVLVLQYEHRQRTNGELRQNLSVRKELKIVELGLDRFSVMPSRDVVVWNYKRIGAAHALPAPAAPTPPPVAATQSPVTTTASQPAPPAAMPRDADGDGVPDLQDECPSLGGPASNHGCPISQPDPDGPAEHALPRAYAALAGTWLWEYEGAEMTLEIGADGTHRRMLRRGGADMWAHEHVGHVEITGHKMKIVEREAPSAPLAPAEDWTIRSVTSTTLTIRNGGETWIWKRQP